MADSRIPLDSGESRFEELKRYVRFDAEDAKALHAFRPLAAPHFTRIAREFYERTREHEEAHAVFTGEAQIERLQRSMVGWMERILSGTYDETYWEEARKIGRVHVKVGLPQRYMFTAMALLRVALEAVADDRAGVLVPPGHWRGQAHRFSRIGRACHSSQCAGVPPLDLFRCQSSSFARAPFDAGSRSPSRPGAFAVSSIT